MRKEGIAHKIVKEKTDLDNLGRILSDDPEGGHCSSGGGNSDS